MMEPETVEATSRTHPSEECAVLRQRVIELETQLQQAQSNMGQQLRFVEALLAAIPTPVFFKDAQGRYLGCNDAFTEQMGVTAEDLRGKTVYELWPSELAETYHQRDLELLRHPERQVYEFQVRDKDGQKRDVVFAKGVFYDEVGQPAGLVGAYVDITERKQAEVELQASETRYKQTSMMLEALFDAIPDVLGIQDTEHGLVRYNKSGYEFVQRTPDQVKGRKCFEMIGRSEVCEVCATRDLYSTLKPARVEKYVEELDIWLDVRAYPILDDDGKLLMVIEHLRDITDRKRAEEALRESERRYRLLAENSTDVIWTMDMNLRSTYTSPAVKYLRGYDSATAMAQTLAEALTPASAEIAWRALQEELALEQRPEKDLSRSRTMEFEVIRADGASIWVESKITFIRDAEGNPIEILGVSRDITERRQVELALQNRLVYEHLLSQLSSLAVTVAELSEFFAESLAAMGNALGVSRAYIFEIRHETDTMDNTAEWCAPGVTPQKDNLQGIPNIGVSWWTESLRAGQDLSYTDIENIPDPQTRELLRAQQILSIWVVPLFVDGRYFGFMGFDDCYQQREWPEDAVELILSMSRMISNVIERKQAEMALRASEARYRSLIEQSNDAIYLLFEDHFELVNPRFEELFGVTAAEVCAPDFDFMSLVAPKSRQLIEARENQLEAGQPVPPRYEFTAINRAGQELEVEVSVSYISYRGVRATQGILRDVTERKHMEQVLRNSEERAWRQRTAIAGLVLNDTLVAGETSAVLRRITQVLSETLSAERASIWTLSQDGSEMQCQALFEAGAAELRADMVLRTTQFPRYFEAILTESRVCVEDAQSDPRTNELTASYLRPLGITSMLDTGILVEGVLRGIICLEHVGSIRKWYPDEEAFASTVASIVAQTFSNVERRRAEAALRASEEQYRTLVRNVPIGVYRNTAGPQGRFLMANPAFLAMFGFASEEELASISVADLYQDPAERALFSAQLLAQGRVTGAELLLRRRDGCPIWGLVTAQVTHKDDGEVAWFDCTLQDVTERKHTEIALRRQLKELTVLHAVASACAQAVDEDQLIAELTRLMRQELYPENMGLFVVDAAAGRLVSHASYQPNAGPSNGVIQLGEGVIGLAASEGQPYRVDNVDESPHCKSTSPGTHAQLTVPVKLGEQVLAVINAESGQSGVFTAADERLLLTVANQLAIAIQRIRLDRETQRRLIELEALRRASREIMTAGMDRERVCDSVHRVVSGLMPAEAFVITLRDPVRNENEVVYLIDKGGRWPTRRFPSNTGLSGYVISRGESVLVDDLTQQSQIPVVHLGAPDLVRSLLAAPLRSGERIVGMLSTQSYHPHAYTQQDQVLLETLANHLGAGLENIRLFQQTQEQARQVQALVDTVPEGVLLLDADQRVVVANPAAQCKIALLSDIRAGSVITHLGGRPLTELLTAPRQGLWHEVEADGHIFEVVAQSIEKGLEPERWVLVVNDATQERIARRQLERQERLAAIGQLASGIAHDFRNLLTTIILYAHLGQRRPDLPPDVRHHLEIIMRQARAATDLTEQILDFARRTEIDRRPLELVAFVGGVMAVLQRTLPENIHMSFDVGPGAHVIEGDPGRLQQVLTNLALNARDAMPNGGDLRISLTRLKLEPGEVPPVPEMPLTLTPSAWICLSVTDSGSGMMPEVQARLFQPFFTTKREGKGTGLGLAQVYGIVQLHAGYIDVITAPGEGTTFRIFLPAAEAAVAASASQSATIPSGKGEVLLLVEDDPHLRQASARILTELGYQVLTAANGREALPLFQTEHAIALVITDLVMPELGGKALLNLLRDQAPHLRALAMTGHTTDESLESLQTAGFLDVIRKPFDLETLALAVRRALDAV